LNFIVKLQVQPADAFRLELKDLSCRNSKTHECDSLDVKCNQVKILQGLQADYEWFLLIQRSTDPENKAWQFFTAGRSIKQCLHGGANFAVLALLISRRIEKYISLETKTYSFKVFVNIYHQLYIIHSYGIVLRNVWSQKYSYPYWVH
jgi:hypothetical protein